MEVSLAYSVTFTVPVYPGLDISLIYAFLL